MLIIYASVCLAGSIALFVFRPIEPVGLVGAIALGLVVIELLCLAFFPAQIGRILRRVEKDVEKEAQPTHLGRWVP